ncbi:MAG: zinc dependent phospholipase C family protein [Lachnospiraceae bacterium]|nr:zinc dependent phospholipase C family protein [Lachnospiraceae bacterium]
MKKKDHRELAEYWVRRMDHRIPLLKRMAFIFGNFEPDINYLTYLHGFTHYRNFLGHHYDHVFPVLLHLIDRYENSLFSITAYYRLGKCFHYTADIFTYPHNPCFSGSMKEHVQYEMQLHECIHTVLGKEENELHRRMFRGDLDADDIREGLTKMHEKYLKEAHSCELDLWYILNATQLLAEAYLYTEEERTERIHPDEPMLLPPEEWLFLTPAFGQLKNL